MKNIQCTNTHTHTNTDLSITVYYMNGYVSLITYGMLQWFNSVCITEDTMSKVVGSLSHCIEKDVQPWPWCIFQSFTKPCGLYWEAPPHPTSSLPSLYHWCLRPVPASTPRSLSFLWTGACPLKCNIHPATPPLGTLSWYPTALSITTPSTWTLGQALPLCIQQASPWSPASSTVLQSHLLLVILQMSPVLSYPVPLHFCTAFHPHLPNKLLFAFWTLCTLYCDDVFIITGIFSQTELYN